MLGIEMGYYSANTSKSNCIFHRPVVDGVPTPRWTVFACDLQGCESSLQLSVVCTTFHYLCKKERDTVCVCDNNSDEKKN